MGVRLQVPLPGPLVWQSEPRPRRCSSGCFVWVLAVAFLAATTISLVRWWLSDWHWTWSTPLVITLAGVISALVGNNSPE